MKKNNKSGKQQYKIQNGVMQHGKSKTCSKTTKVNIENLNTEIFFTEIDVDVIG